MKFIPASTAVFAAAAASLLLGPALAIGSSHPHSDIIRVHNLNKPDEAVRWPSAQDTAAPAALNGQQVSPEESEDEGAEGTAQVKVAESTPVREPQGDNRAPATESTPLDGRPELQPELKRSGDGGVGTGAVLLRRETSAAPTIYGVSIWLILAWLALLYLMYKTGSMF